jgi:hypothetical protein
MKKGRLSSSLLFLLLKWKSPENFSMTDVYITRVLYGMLAYLKQKIQNAHTRILYFFNQS